MPDDSLIGRSLGGFQILDKIGEGGMGVVYRAREAALQREVAVKVLPTVLAADKKCRERFVREARALARIAHPNLVHVYSVGEDAGRFYFAMELIDGEPVSKARQRRGAFAPNVAARICIQVLHALAPIHKAGIIHRDVKSSNIMLASDGRAVLMDFGLAKDESAEGLTTTGMILGTPEYMSPEQALGKPAGHRSDVYSVGVVLFEMVTGQLPYAGKSALAILRKHTDEPIPDASAIRRNVPGKLADVICKAMAKSPKGRFASAEEMAKALEVFAGTGRPAPAARDGKKRAKAALSASAARTLAARKAAARAKLSGDRTLGARSAGVAPTGAKPRMPVSSMPTGAAGPSRAPTAEAAESPPRTRAGYWGAVIGVVAVAAAVAIAVFLLRGKYGGPAEEGTVTPKPAGVQEAATGEERPGKAASTPAVSAKVPAAEPSSSSEVRPFGRVSVPGVRPFDGRLVPGGPRKTIDGWTVTVERKDGSVVDVPVAGLKIDFKPETDRRAAPFSRYGRPR